MYFFKAALFSFNSAKLIFALSGSFRFPSSSARSYFKRSSCSLLHLATRVIQVANINVAAIASHTFSFGFNLLIW
jgi:hypothetical protein